MQYTIQIMKYLSDLTLDKISGTLSPPDKNGKNKVFLAIGSKSLPHINLKLYIVFRYWLTKKIVKYLRNGKIIYNITFTFNGRIGLEDHTLSVLLTLKNNGFHISSKDKL